MKYLSICTISFVSLFFFSLLSFLMGMIFIMNDYTIFIEWEVVSMNLWLLKHIYL